GLNGPRISAGASGFMSQRSRWLGAPRLKIMMQERSSCPGFTTPAARAAMWSGRERPMAPKVPTCRKSRRVTPLHVKALPFPVKVSIHGSPYGFRTQSWHDGATSNPDRVPPTTSRLPDDVALEGRRAQSGALATSRSFWTGLGDRYP